LGERLTAPIGVEPVPERATIWGLPLALSLMLTEAVRLPLAVGVKVTLIVQFPPGATELPQVLVWAKSLAFVPVIARLARVKAPLPTLARAMVRTALVVLTDWLAKVRLDGERLTTGEVGAAGVEGPGAEPVGVPGLEGLGAGAVAVPERLIVWGLPPALSVILSKADRLPLAVGVKVTLIVQLTPGRTELPQLLVWRKSPAFAPAIVRLVISKIPLPRSLTEMV